MAAADQRALYDAQARLHEAGAALDSGSSMAGLSTALALWSDPVAAAMTGARSALAIAITSVFWIETAWPSGATAVIIVAVVCSLIASMEQPAKISLALAVTVLIAAVPVFGTLFYLLPFASDFPSMAAALAPLLVVCGFIIAEPGIGPFGTFAAVYFSVVSNIDNVMPYDSVGFLNNSVAILIGIGVALVLFATFFPETSAQAGRRFRRQLLVGLSRLAGARYPLSKLMKAPFMNDSPRYWGVSRTSQMRHAGALRAL